MTNSVPTAALATTVRAVKDTSVITAVCVPIVQYSVWDAAKLAKGVPNCVRNAMSIVQNVTIISALTAVCVMIAPGAKKISVILVICVRIAL